MSYAALSTVCAITGTLIILLIYVYFYKAYREAFTGAWIVAWLLHFIRISIFDLGMPELINNPVGCLFYQGLFILCTIILMYSAHLFLSKKLHIYWKFAAIYSFILSLILDFTNINTSWKLIPSTWFSGVVLFYLSYLFNCKLDTNCIGKKITSFAFCIWGFLTASVFFFYNHTEIPTGMLACGGIIRLLIAIGVLVIYLEKTKKLVDNSSDIIFHFRIHPKAKVEYVSPSVYMITGYEKEEFYANPRLLQNIIHPDDRWAYDVNINQSAWPSDIPMEYRLIHKNKEIIDIEQTFIFIYDTKKEVVGWQGTLRDVTARNHAKHAELLYDRLYMVGKTSVSFADQIRNPLTTIKGYLQIFRKKYNNDNDSISLMLDEVTHANSVISEYLLLSDEKRVNLKNCFLNTLITQTILLFKDCAAAAGIVIKTELSELPSLKLDEEEMRCLLSNLIKNAIDAMPYGGELLLSTRITSKPIGNNEVVLSIRDTGIGMPDNIVENFGTPFLTTKPAGIGLGLPICCRIATRNHASIQVNTNTKGTTFKIHFLIPKIPI